LRKFGRYNFIREGKASQTTIIALKHKGAVWKFTILLYPLSLTLDLLQPSRMAMWDRMGIIIPALGDPPPKTGPTIPKTFLPG
jgi:hypothetical protein